MAIKIAFLLIPVAFCQGHPDAKELLANVVPISSGSKDHVSITKLQHYPDDGKMYTSLNDPNITQLPTDPKYFLGGMGCCTTFTLSGMTKMNFKFEASQDPKACMQKAKGGLGADFQPMACEAAKVFYPPSDIVAELPCPDTQAELAKASATYTDYMHQKDGLNSRMQYNKEKLDEVKKANEILDSLKNDPNGAQKTALLKDKAKELAAVEGQRTKQKRDGANHMAEENARFQKEHQNLVKDIAELRTGVYNHQEAIANVRKIIMNSRMSEVGKIEAAVKMSSICGTSDPSLPQDDQFGC